EGNDTSEKFHRFSQDLIPLKKMDHFTNRSVTIDDNAGSNAPSTILPYTKYTHEITAKKVKITIRPPMSRQRRTLNSKTLEKLNSPIPSRTPNSNVVVFSPVVPLLIRSCSDCPGRASRCACSNMTAS